MARFKYANEEHTLVNDLESGTCGIHAGLWQWSQVEQWVREGNTIEPFKTAQETSQEILKVKVEELVQVKRESKDKQGILVDGILFDTDLGARVAYIELYLKFITNPSYVVNDWKASDGVWVTMDNVMFKKLMAAWEVRLSSLFTFIREKEQELAQATDVSQVSIDYQG